MIYSFNFLEVGILNISNQIKSNLYLIVGTGTNKSMWLAIENFITFDIPIYNILSSIVSLQIMLGNSNGLLDEFLRTYIDDVFDKYDTDKSGSLDAQQMTYFWKDLFQKLGMPTNITLQDSEAAIKSIDLDGNGTIQKHELFKAFKLISTQNLLMQQKIQNNQNYGHPMYGGNHWGQPMPPPPYTYQQQPPTYYQYNPYSSPYMNMNYNPNNNPQQYQQYQPQYDPMMGQMNNPFANNQAKGNWGNQQNNNKMNESKGQGQGGNMGSSSRFGGSWAKNSMK